MGGVGRGLVMRKRFLGKGMYASATKRAHQGLLRQLAADVLEE